MELLGSSTVNLLYLLAQLLSTTIQGQATNDNTNMKSVIGGGVGNSAEVIDNFSGTQINIGSADGQIDVLSPGMAQASSMSNGTSDFQAVAGNHDASGNDDLTLSIGTIQIDKIGLKNGGVFDWEITDFAGNNADGSDWDVLKFDNLDFTESSDSFDINIYSLASNGSAGGVSVDGSNHLWVPKQEPQDSSLWNGLLQVQVGIMLNLLEWLMGSISTVITGQWRITFTTVTGVCGMKVAVLPSVLCGTRAIHIFYCDRFINASGL